MENTVYATTMKYIPRLQVSRMRAIWSAIWKMLHHIYMSDRPLLIASCWYIVLKAKKAPPIHKTWRSGTHSIHFMPMVMRMNSRETSERPKSAGKEKKAVKRISLRNTRRSRSLSSAICASTGCATCSIVPVIVLYAIVFHLFAWVKLPTAAMGNLWPMINVSTLLLMVLMIEVTSILTLNENIRRIGEKSTCSDGRHLS